MHNTSRITAGIQSVVIRHFMGKLKQGIVPWQQSWAVSGFPMNLASGYYYRGINIWLMHSLGFQRNLFLTFDQVKELGGSVKKSAKACPVIYWKPEEHGELKKWKVVYHQVFNIEQCINLPAHLIPVFQEYTTNPIPNSEALVANIPNGAKIQERNTNGEFYDVERDTILMPDSQNYGSPELYYQSLFRLLIQSTGDITRLKRKDVITDALILNKPYSAECLIADMGMCHLASMMGMQEIICQDVSLKAKNWLAQLENNEHLLFYASRKAQSAVDFLLGNLHEGNAIRASKLN